MTRSGPPNRSQAAATRQHPDRAQHPARSAGRSRRRRLSRTVQVVVPIVVAGGAVAVLSTFWPVPAWVAWVYVVMSVVTYALYAKDKAAARDRRWRVAESTLHLVSLLGGWPGALLAQQVLRHKTVKVSFRAAFWCTVVANLVLLAALCSPVAAPLRQGVVDAVDSLLG